MKQQKFECRKKRCTETEGLELNHFIPKCLDEDSEKRLKRLLCKKHHDIFHYSFSCWMWGYVPTIRKDEVINKLEKRGERWLQTPD